MQPSRLHRLILPALLTTLATLSELVGCGAANHAAGFSGDDGDTADAAPPSDAGPLPWSDAGGSFGDGGFVQDRACFPGKGDLDSTGCDFYAHVPIALYPGCFAVFIANTWTTPLSVRAEAQGSPIDVSKSIYLAQGSGTSLTYTPLPGGEIPTGQVGILFARDVDHNSWPLFACPQGVTAVAASAAPTWNDPAAEVGGGDPKRNNSNAYALHLSTSAPAVAYDIFPFGGGRTAITAATLLLPTATWGTGYLLVTPWTAGAGIGGEWYPAVSVVASDDTDFTLNSPVGVDGNPPAVPGAQPNVPVTYHLTKGQVFRFEQYAPLVGATLSSTKPVGVWAEQECMIIDDYRACDSAHQQIFPVGALGSDYAAVRYRNRFDGVEEAPPWRIAAAVDGTTLTYDPALPADAGAPAALNKGQSAVFHASGPFAVHSQDASHPFTMNAYMPSAGWASLLAGYPSASIGLEDGGAPIRGDPEFVNTVPPAQFDTEYVFFADPTYPETDLVFVRTKGKDGAFHDVTLDCAGVLGGWQPVDGAHSYEYTRIDLVRHTFTPQGMCNTGRREAHSDAPFGVTVWGWGSEETGTHCQAGSCDPGYSEWVSYAYPVGQRVGTINPVVVK